MRFYLLHPGIPEPVLKRILASWVVPGRHIHTTAIHLPLEWVADLVRSKSVSRMAYGRLFIGDLLPKDVKRCVYHDSDLLLDRKGVG